VSGTQSAWRRRRGHTAGPADLASHRRFLPPRCAGDSARRMIASWRPVTNTSRAIFLSRPRQGDIFDCYLISAMAALQSTPPSGLRTKKSVNASGQYCTRSTTGRRTSIRNNVAPPAVQQRHQEIFALDHRPTPRGWPGLLEGVMTLQRRLSGNPIRITGIRRRLTIGTSPTMLYPHEVPSVAGNKKIAGSPLMCHLFVSGSQPLRPQ
jgi:hypothetical protein